MGKVTSKYQVSLPKALADRLGVRPGDEIDWHLAGNEFRAVPHGSRKPLSVAERLSSFDEATRRQRARDRATPPVKSDDRGWKREDLYGRGRTR